MNLYLILVITIIFSGYFLGLISDFLNIRHLALQVPEEFKGVYDADKYEKSQKYLCENTVFGLIKETVFLFVILGVIFSGAFNTLDIFIRSWGFSVIINGLLFFAALGAIGIILGLPFSVYHTFVIEKKYGFNRTTAKTFILDLIKGVLLTIILGGIVSAAVLWFFNTAGPHAWLLVWGFLTLFQLFMMIISPVVIMPLFNKYEDLEPGALKTAIESYAAKVSFPIKGVYKMDGSRRSTKTNAFFTGLGRFRRIVLFDTLIQKHGTEELVAVIAHEVGHYKKRHIYKGLFLSIFTSGLTLYFLSLFLNNPGLFAAFKMQYTSIYASLIFFSFIYSPIEVLLGLFSGYLSRKYEYEADRYSVETTDSKESIITALKNLSVENLSNLTPHWFKVVLSYSHPPILDRIKAIRNI